MNAALNDPLNLCNGCDMRTATGPGGYCKTCLESDSNLAGPRYPDIEVVLIGQDGNAFHIIGVTRRAMKRHGVPQEDIQAYMDEATSGDYDNLLTTTMKWVTVE